MNQMCKVCGEPAAGFHFGAFTCEGCKSFFGRSYNNLSALGECKNSGNCVINKKNRTSCKSCRLKKCLMVGMSKAGSRYGRRSNWFKIHCLIQEQAEKQAQAEQGILSGGKSSSQKRDSPHTQGQSQSMKSSRSSDENKDLMSQYKPEMMVRDSHSASSHLSQRTSGSPNSSEGSLKNGPSLFSHGPLDSSSSSVPPSSAFRPNGFSPIEARFSASPASMATENSRKVAAASLYHSALVSQIPFANQSSLNALAGAGLPISPLSPLSPLSVASRFLFNQNALLAARQQELNHADLAKSFPSFYGGELMGSYAAAAAALQSRFFSPLHALNPLSPLMMEAKEGKHSPRIANNTSPQTADTPTHQDNPMDLSVKRSPSPHQEEAEKKFSISAI